MAMEQMQQQLQLAQQWVINQQAGVPGSMNAAIWRRKMREVYVGNLAMNVVNEHILAEVFNSALGELCDNPRGAPPVVQVNMSTDMKYAFVEMRTHALSDAAMHLDGVELCGRVMKVGRPKGWTPDVAKQCAENPGAEDAAAAAAARRFNGEEGADDAAVVKPPFQDDNKDFYRAKINSTEDRTFLRDGIRSNLPDGADVNEAFPPTPLQGSRGRRVPIPIASIYRARGVLPRRLAWGRARADFGVRGVLAGVPRGLARVERAAA